MINLHLLTCSVLLLVLAINSANSESGDKTSKFQRSSNWSVMRGSWGKRDWKSARGMWGKRGEPDLDEADAAADDVEKRNWNKASGMWGKRAPLWDDEDQLTERQYAKRGWEKAAGMWGKRTGWNSAKGMWGRRKREALGMERFGPGKVWTLLCILV